MRRTKFSCKPSFSVVCGCVGGWIAVYTTASFFPARFLRALSLSSMHVNAPPCATKNRFVLASDGAVAILCDETFLEQVLVDAECTHDGSVKHIAKLAGVHLTLCTLTCFDYFGQSNTQAPSPHDLLCLSSPYSPSCLPPLHALAFLSHILLEADAFLRHTLL